MAAVFGNAETARALGDGAGGERGGVGGGAGIVGHWKEVMESHMAPGNVAPNRPAAPTKGQIRTESKDLHAFFCSFDCHLPRLATRWQPSPTNCTLGLDQNIKERRLHSAMFISPGGNAVQR